MPNPQKVTSSSRSVRIPDDIWMKALSRYKREKAPQPVVMSALIVDLLAGYGQGYYKLPELKRVFK